ncbi:MAG: chemotaxis-specific protein-glutamate methyltransferase CheB [Myxococcaceae bacterium]|nr:chemotaxis-specific protein-glutamate methyltransferase CheB [Myxococcaceae bacterium]MCA3011479.1 chemotaxis-specific protein-glutamate methyltransferase CheB [Myxococcaceae bacterium]
MNRKCQVLVVDDSPLCRQLIIDAITQDPDVEVVGFAADGEEAIRLVAELKPQVITMDVDMPVLDGLSACERIMSELPTPILVLTADPQNQAPALTHRALAAGALALQVKPALDAGPDAWNLAREVKLLSTVKVIRHLRGVKRPGAPAVSAAPPEAALSGASPVGLVVVAASTGGPQVVHKLVSELPVDFPAPVLLVQHINAAFADSLVGWLGASARLKVRAARDGDLLAPGTVLVAPPGAHLTIPSRGRVAVTQGVPRDGYLPSASMLLESAAKTYGKRVVGVILTGMGTDGVDGLAAVRAAGGTTVAQSQESSVVFGMPGAAIAHGVVDHVVHGDEMGRALVRLARGQAPSR